VCNTQHDFFVNFAYGSIPAERRRERDVRNGINIGCVGERRWGFQFAAAREAVVREARMRSASAPVFIVGAVTSPLALSMSDFCVRLPATISMLRTGGGDRFILT
jgi:hypothetical protein